MKDSQNAEIDVVCSARKRRKIDLGLQEMEKIRAMQLICTGSFYLCKGLAHLIINKK